MDSIQINKIKPVVIIKWVRSHWLGLYRSLWLAVFIAAMAFGSYSWYRNLYQTDWDEAEKNDFLKKQPKEGNLERALLNKVIQEIEDKQKQAETEVFAGKDIFRPY